MKDNPTVDQWLAKLPPDLQKFTRELIIVARKNMLDAHEFIYQDAAGYSVKDSPFDRICYIFSSGVFLNVFLPSWRASRNVFLTLPAVQLVPVQRSQRKR